MSAITLSTGAFFGVTLTFTVFGYIMGLTAGIVGERARQRDVRRRAPE